MKDFEYVIMFGEEYIDTCFNIEKAIKMTKSLSKGLKQQGLKGIYSIICSGIVIAQF